MSTKTEMVMGYQFEGPYNITASNFNEAAGIYLIADNNGKVVDVGETDQLATRIANHERKNCWDRNDASILWFHGESNQQSRIIKEKKLRIHFDPACGIK